LLRRTHIATGAHYVCSVVRAGERRPIASHQQHDQKGQRMLTASAVMNEDLVTIRPEASIKEAIELLISKEISGLPVVDGQGRLVGVITEFALLAMVYDQQVQDHPVSRHMTREVITIDVDDPINRIADLCIVHRVRRLPVMRGGKLVGLIARRDVLKALYQGAPQPCLA
jgi:CBS domain-containing protein